MPKLPEQFQGLNLLGCLFNTFIYIEISGTGGSAFRPMYAKFLDEASEILSEYQLKEGAERFRDSGKIWSEIAASALPDFWPTLKRIRELSFEKNRIFEEQKIGALERMRNINIELDNLMKEAEKDLQKKELAALLDDLKYKIFKCYAIEEQAFKMLSF
ncbi:unnamed protein product [marine sediment metagenome]|uniref:DUF4872 domain-containing protein n=1 Tax=marine sediment metagenome TaxID=412755 RepID=X1STX9_9ZZZZ